MTKIISSFLKLLISFIIGLSIGTVAIYSYHANSYRPYTWISPPIVVNCYGSDLNSYKIESAFNFWKSHNNNIEFILHDPPKSVCNNDLLRGFILIKKTKNIKGNALAKTKVKVEYMKIRAATIYLEPGVYNIEWLLEHEAGHAFGYKHIEAVGNIMHPYIELQGGKYWIPEN
jgi:hypothetical protein